MLLEVDAEAERPRAVLAVVAVRAPDEVNEKKEKLL